MIGREKVRIEKLENPKAFIDYSHTIYDVYEKLDNCNPKKKRKLVLVLHYMIADIEANKKVSQSA